MIRDFLTRYSCSYYSSMLLAKAKVNDKNVKEQANNEINQKDPPQLNKSISVSSFKLKNSK